MKVNFRTSLIQIVGLIIYVMWAAGIQNVSIWHWIIPLVVDGMGVIVTEILRKMEDK